MQSRQKPLEVVTPAHGVAIHAANASRGKYLGETLFALLRSRTQVVQVLAVALGTTRRHRAPIAAIMALEPLALARNLCLVRRRLVMSERNGAVLALELCAARPAHHGEGIAAPVEQDQGLFSAIEGGL